MIVESRLQTMIFYKIEKKIFHHEYTMGAGAGSFTVEIIENINLKNKCDIQGLCWV